MSRYYTPATRDRFGREKKPEAWHWEQMHTDLAEMTALCRGHLPISEGIPLGTALAAARALIGEKVPRK